MPFLTSLLEGLSQRLSGFLRRVGPRGIRKSAESGRSATEVCSTWARACSPSIPCLAIVPWLGIGPARDRSAEGFGKGAFASICLRTCFPLDGFKRHSSLLDFVFLPGASTKWKFVGFTLTCFDMLLLVCKWADAGLVVDPLACFGQEVGWKLAVCTRGYLFYGGGSFVSKPARPPYGHPIICFFTF